MSKMFYPKLAAGNLKKQSKTYLPYLFTCTGMAAMFYMISSLSQNKGIDEVIGSSTMRGMLGMGVGITAIFSFVFLFYTNSFLVKRRKKELGLYNILGMEKRHIAKVIFFETVYVLVLSVGAGLALGVLADKLLFLAVLRMIGAPVPLGFAISPKAMVDTLLLFGFIFLCIYGNSVRQIHLAKPIELLHGGEVGEKEPKTKWVMAALGLLSLGAGYYLAVSVQNPVTAMSVFFIAVLLVMIGTYFLFTAGSIALLKFLRKRKSYYYKTRHFISVSGMIYRMKQNAVGLANICLMSTAVLVMISSTSSLWIGVEDAIRERYPNDYVFYADDASEESRAAAYEVLEQALDKSGLTETGRMEYALLSFAALETGAEFSLDRENASAFRLENYRNLFFIPLDDYNRITGESRTLGDGEVLLYANRVDYPHEHFSIAGREFRVKERLEKFPENGMVASNITSTYFFVVKDMNILRELDQIQRLAYGKDASELGRYYGIDVSEQNSDRVLAGGETIQAELEAQGISGKFEIREEEWTSIQGLYGSLFFLGVFLGMLLLVATVLIIYYKQVTEGYEDAQRFQIMEKVGLTKKEIKASVHAQVLTVFFLPLITAVIHLCFAFPVISKLLAALNLVNVSLFLVCTLGSVLLFAVFYTIVYLLTSKVYYKLVA